MSYVWSTATTLEGLVKLKTPPEHDDLDLTWHDLDAQVEHSSRLHFTRLAQICFNHLSDG